MPRHWVLSLAILVATACTLPGTNCTARQPAREPRDRLDRALLDAVRTNRVGDVKDLLARGANADAIAVKTHDEDTALVIAAREGYVEIARTLLAAGANVNLRQHGTFEGATPLIAAAAAGHTEIVNLLLEHGANLNARSWLRGTGPTALHWAASHGYVEPVILLLAYGATIERRDLQAAISEGHLEIATRLLEAGGDPRWTFSNGRTVVEEAQRSPKEVRAKMVATVRMFIGPGRVPPN